MAEARKRSKIASKRGGRVEIMVAAAAVGAWARCCFWEGGAMGTRAAINCEFIVIFCFDDRLPSRSVV